MRTRVKTTLLDGRVRLNTAVFYSVYKDFQSQSCFDPDGTPPTCPDDEPDCNIGDDPGAFILVNAGEVSTQGVELDFLAQGTENLRLTVGVAYVDARIDDYPAGQCSGGQVFRAEGECTRANSLQDHSDRWTATVFVKNIANKFYASAILPNNPNILPNAYNHR